MDIPSPLTSRLVEGRYGLGVIDGPDEDSEPQLIPAQGTITFRPEGANYLIVNADQPDTVAILLTEFTGVLDTEGYLCTPLPDGKPGARGLRLFTTDDPAASTTGWTWKATPRLTTPAGVILLGAIQPFGFPLPGGEGALNLNKVTKVPASPGIGVDQAPGLVAAAQASAAEALGVVRRLQQIIEDGLPTGGGEGTQGPQGPAGPEGPVGPKGDTGVAGAKGDKGDPGATGTTGAKGDRGDAGPQGIQGIQGPKGDTGTQGVQGPAGPVAGAKVTASTTAPANPAVGDVWLDISA